MSRKSTKPRGDNPLRQLLQEIDEYSRSELGKAAGCEGKCYVCANKHECDAMRRRYELLRKAGGNPYHWDPPPRPEWGR
jgi:hypothetical protein